MTDRVTIGLFSLAGFLLVLALLGSQLGVARHAAPVRPHEVLVRRIYRTTVIERVPRSATGGSAGGGGGATVSQSVSGSTSIPAAPAAPVTRTS